MKPVVASIVATFFFALSPAVRAADLDADGADDNIEVFGGTALVDLTGSSTNMTMLWCDRSFATPSASSRSCVSYPFVVNDNFSVLALGRVTGEWDEDTESDGGWNFSLAYPNLTAASRKAEGVRVTWTSGQTCYEGYIQTLGGGYDASSGQSWTYWFPTGRFVACTR